MTEIDVTDQSVWAAIVHNSCFTIKGVCDEYGLSARSFRPWLHGIVKPRKTNHEKVSEVMKKLITQPKLIKHPSYGYATEDQIKKLNEIGLGPDRDVILKKIAEQTKLAGKVK